MVVVIIFHWFISPSVNKLVVTSINVTVTMKITVINEVRIAFIKPKTIIPVSDRYSMSNPCIPIDGRVGDIVGVSS